MPRFGRSLTLPAYLSVSSAVSCSSSSYSSASSPSVGNRGGLTGMEEEWNRRNGGGKCGVSLVHPKNGRQRGRVGGLNGDATQTQTAFAAGVAFASIGGMLAD
jgi:hypothetical protein